MSHSDRKQNNKFSFWFTCLISDSRQNLLFKIYIKHILVLNNRFFFLSGIMMSQYAKSNKSDMWQIWLLHHVTHRICWLVWQVGLIYKKKQPPNTHFFFLPPNTFLSCAEPTPFPKQRDLLVTNLQTNFLSFLSTQRMAQWTGFSLSWLTSSALQYLCCPFRSCPH